MKSVKDKFLKIEANVEDLITLFTMYSSYDLLNKSIKYQLEDLNFETRLISSNCKGLLREINSALDECECQNSRIAFLKRIYQKSTKLVDKIDSSYAFCVTDINPDFKFLLENVYLRKNGFVEFIKEINILIELECSGGLSDKEYLTIDETAIRLRKSKNSIYKLTSKRLLPFTKLGKSIIFLKSDVDLYIKALSLNTRDESVKNALNFVSGAKTN